MGPSFIPSQSPRHGVTSKFFLNRCHTLSWNKVKDGLIVFDELNHTKDREMFNILLQVFLLIMKQQNPQQNPSAVKRKIKTLKNTFN